MGRRWGWCFLSGMLDGWQIGELWARVLSDVRAEEASAALVVLARRGLANPVKPGSCWRL